MLKRFLPPIIWAVIIFILSSIPGNDYPKSVFNYSYIAHFLEFFVLAVLSLKAAGVNKNKQIYLTLICCGLYALSDELHQLFVINRSSSFLDWLVDFFGIILGIKFWMWLSKK